MGVRVNNNVMQLQCIFNALNYVTSANIFAALGFLSVFIEANKLGTSAFGIH